MKAKFVVPIGLALAAFVTPPLAVAQNDVPPVITNVVLEISRNAGLLPFVAFTPDGSTLAGIAQEADIIRITLTITDEDWDETTTDFELYIRKQSEWAPYVGSAAPEPPPILSDNLDYVAPPNIIPVNTTTVTVTLFFVVPDFLGANQARLAGQILWDVRWFISIRAANEEEPDDETPVAEVTFPFWAVENPNRRAPNPPPFADAGGNQDVALDAVTRQVEVVLDASRTFDLNNLGFDPTDPYVFEKDDLQFIWEWVSGPVQIPAGQFVSDPSNPARTRVLLNTPSPPDYVFRVLVDDGVNAQVSTASVAVHVRSSAPTNAAPVAVVAGPTDTVPVGSTITLDASGSWDPDSGDTENLTFRWRQTNEVGGELSIDQVLTTFQPLSGQNAATASWRAVAEGTYYFRVLVRDQPQLRDSFLTDQGLSDTATVTVVVAGTAATSGQQSDREDTGGKQSIRPLGCGGGLFPLAVLPALLWLLRGRYR